MKFLILLNMLFSAKSMAETKHLLNVKSGSQQINLVELYSSEGCSSCPPADQYLTKLVDSEGVWTKFIPITFHVDYWNYIGWKDVFSNEKMTDRQKSIAATWKDPSVYTPGFMVNGSEWRQWRSEKPISFDHKKTIEIELSQDKDLSFNVSVSQSKNLRLHVALVGFGLETDVKAGENNGRKLVHDFVVLDWLEKKTNVKPNEKVNFKFYKPKAKYKKLAAVAWVEDVSSPIALQAVGGYLTMP